MEVKILQIREERELSRLFDELKVDPYGSAIMSPKAMAYVIRLDSLSCASANILKQEMLSLGGDAALPRDVLTGRIKKPSCLLLGNKSQLIKLCGKLLDQPFGLSRIGTGLRDAITAYEKNSFILAAGKHRIKLGESPVVMGIMNLTPDSLSGDGIYAKSRDLGQIERKAGEMLADGAGIIDIGGESTRPGSKGISVAEELKRTIFAVKAVVKKFKVPVSIDTSKPEVAEQALDNGACLVNDITGLASPKMARTAARYGAAVVIMHMKGSPRDMQIDPRYDCVTSEIIDFLSARVKQAAEAGIRTDGMIIDPGIGFGKKIEHNLAILKNLSEFRILGLPILVGTSRKGFIGTLTGAEPSERAPGTIATCVAAVERGCHIVRVHDVKQIKQALKVTEAISHA